MYGDDPAPSPLCLPGGRDCVVELFSFAKSYHMGGFRLGFALGNRDAISSLEAVKGTWRGARAPGLCCLRGATDTPSELMGVAVQFPGLEAGRESHQV